MIEYIIPPVDHVIETGDIASGNDLALNVEPRTDVIDTVSVSDLADLAR